MLGASTTGISCASSAARARSSGVKPVEPMTMAFFFRPQTSRFFSDTLGVVKSMRTSHPSTTAFRSSEICTPRAPQPAMSPASWPTMVVPRPLQCAGQLHARLLSRRR